MITGLAYTALVVDEYENALDFYCGILGFKLIEDIPLKDKRWVRIRPPGGGGADILLSRAINEKQKEAIGNQTGGRVLFFLYTDDLQSDYDCFFKKGVEFTEGPLDCSYGKLAVFKDLYGNRIDLIEPLT